MAITSPTREIPTRTVLELDGASLTIGDALEVSRRGCTVQLSEPAARAVSASKRLKDELIAKEIPIYGVTTGFGDSAHRQISPGKAARLQQNIMRFMGVGTGPICTSSTAVTVELYRIFEGGNRQPNLNDACTSGTQGSQGLPPPRPPDML